MASKVLPLSKRIEKLRAVKSHRAAGRKRATAVDMLKVLRARIGRTKFRPAPSCARTTSPKSSACRARACARCCPRSNSCGLVERIPNRGAVVTRMDLAQVFHIYDVREVLEGLCARLATENVPNKSWQDLLDAFKGPMAELRPRRTSSTTTSPATNCSAAACSMPRANPLARRDARQHLREDAGPDPPHHHPAGPRRDRAARTHRRARGDEARRCRRGRAPAPDQHAQRARRTSSATRNSFSRGPRPHERSRRQGAACRRPAGRLSRARDGLDGGGPVLRAAARGFRRRGHQDRSPPTAIRCAPWASASTASRCMRPASSATSR